MVTTSDTSNKARLLKLSDVIREEQKKLLIEASDFDSFPNKGLIRQIAELELTIVAVDNYLEELNADAEGLAQ